MSKSQKKIDKKQKQQVFKNARQVWLFVTEELGCAVSENTVRSHCKSNKLPKRRGGGYSESTVRNYARNVWPTSVDEDPEKDMPVTPGKGSQDRAVAATADFREVKAKREQFDFDRERGLYTETAVIERELGLRAQAFKLGLERFGFDQAEQVAALFGGTEKTALDLCRSIGISEDLVPMIVTWAQAQGDAFKAMWRPAVADHLDTYSTGAWWDDDMKEAWERMQSNG